MNPPSLLPTSQIIWISIIHQPGGKSSACQFDLWRHVINIEPLAFVDHPTLMKLGSIALDRL